MSEERYKMHLYQEPLKEVIRAITKRLRALETQDPGPAVPIDGKVILDSDDGDDTYITFDGTDVHVFIDGVDQGTIPGGGGGPHSVLSATHSDTTASAVSQGSIIVGDATPKWVELAKGNDDQILRMNGSDPNWEDLPAAGNHDLLSATHPDSVVGSPVQGDLIVGNSTPKWTKLAKGNDDQILRMSGSNPNWEDLPAAANHNLLSATHPDTDAGSSPTRGDILVANSVPAWDDLALGADGRLLASDGNDAVWEAQYGVIQVMFDNQGSVLGTGLQNCYITVPWNCVIEAVRLAADVSGSVVVDIWKDTWANFPPTVADTLIGGGGTKPTLAAARTSRDTTLTNWTTTLTKGDEIFFNIDSASTLTYLKLALEVRKT